MLNLMLFVKIFERVVYSWSPAINVVIDPLQVLKTVRDTSGDPVFNEVIGPQLMPQTQLIHWKHSPSVFNYYLIQIL